MAETNADVLAHAKVGSWFLGPRAENFSVLKELFNHVLDDQARARKKIYTDDPEFITNDMKNLSTYKDGLAALDFHLRDLSDNLSATSVPFWSPRYNGHMNMDTAIPGIIGYMSAMMYNPNNVATEASPYTTKLEREVGVDLCKMLGYNVYENLGLPIAWGHITCGGSVANLEAIWAIRNLKFYPLSLKLAMEEGAPLHFLAHATPAFEVLTCRGTTDKFRGEKKKFTDLSTWELLNLTPDTVLEIPTRLDKEYSISPAFLQSALRDYLAQTVGKDYLEKKFDIKPGKFFLSATKHYSWPKGGAITGIGSANFVDVAVDEDARMNIEDFEAHLDECIAGEDEGGYTPVFGAVAIIGSTEHGACDPLEDMLKVRTRFQERGLSFAIHSDAAWGGYFASFVGDMDKFIPSKPLYLVPAMTLSPHTEAQLSVLGLSDSITIDPHKSGYINYPSGGLCYRDGRMRYLVTWTSPIVFHEGDALESMGVYGVEGSKPGASAAATWLTHKTIGFQEDGYKRLLGEAVFTCTKLYCYWATMTKDEDDFLVVPLIQLPSEKPQAKGIKPADPEDSEDRTKRIEAEKERIRKKILDARTEDLVEDKESWAFLAKLGGDLMINAFACNFKVDGKPNTDVGEANYLNQRLFQRLSISAMGDLENKNPPIILTSSVFGEKAYGKCLSTYKTRLQLDDGASPAHGDLRFLVNVTMSPWPADSDFLGGLVQSFREIAEEEVQRCVRRNRLSADVHGFIIQGGLTGDEDAPVYLTHMPMFYKANHRWQVIVKAVLPREVRALYRDLRAKNPDKFYTAANTAPEFLDKLLSNAAGTEWRMDEGVPEDGAEPLARFRLSSVQVVVKESMSFKDLDQTYPDRMPFYLYGSRAEIHIDHVLKTTPNAFVNSDRVGLNVAPELTDEQLSKGLIAVLDTVVEKSLQPLPLKGKEQEVILDSPGLSLVKGKEHRVSIYESYEDSKRGKAKIASGTITFQENVFADWAMTNMDGADAH
ncbi:pyridoxal phosphate-dependent transferase [Lasiosphaeria miniovina]|uniref:Pyridoxal phosphate-dependent transferase n=1 Tax=Lasiosphaeria miniovina TaxID=1954250 RepID=A0AA39ZQY3_9PEZI|nr:pyridoxal phosphate-dependent transferase [Lasiosphaeria miniovina]KAK0701996.1 pyridoxal phosphate-dependent transferase [Lasiosphaeria miniovina]